MRAWAWWRVTQCGTSSATVRGYLSILNGWHDRQTGVGLAANMSHHRVLRLLDGLAILKGVPAPKKLRVGVRPADLRAGIDAAYCSSDPLHVNMAAAMETGHGGVLRACEYVRGARKVFDPERGSASRADVTFHYDADTGDLLACCLMAVNAKAKRAERFRKLPRYLPIDGKYLSPGRMLYFLTEIADPVPLTERGASTPLFRNPLSGLQIDIAFLRSELKRVMQAAGRPASAIGTHSLRIGGADGPSICGRGRARHQGIWRVEF